MKVSDKTACPDYNLGYEYAGNVYSPAGRHDFAFLFEALSLVFRNLELRSLRLAGMLVFLVILEAACLSICVPTAAITPGPGNTEISSNQLIQVRVPRFSLISEVAVYVNGEQDLVEHNIKSKEFTTPVNARPGSTVVIEIKVESALGLEREMSSTFTTAEPAERT
jgi:hypothetical protein